MQLAINPALEFDRLRAVYRRQNWILMPGFLSDVSLPYHLTLTSRTGEVKKVWLADIESRGREFKGILMTAVYRNASAGFQYLYGQLEFDQHVARGSRYGVSGWGLAGP